MDYGRRVKRGQAEKEVLSCDGISRVGTNSPTIFDFITLTESKMIQAKYLRSLELTFASSAGRPLHLSSASGLVRLGEALYVIADDENHLGIFSPTSDAPGRLTRILPGALPEPKTERKAAKPDFEALACLPACARFPHGSLLAIGSGSTRRRQAAVFLPISATGMADGEIQHADLSRLYQMFAPRIAELNIEGMVARDERLLLFHRENIRNRKNICIELKLSDFYAIVLDDSACMPATDFVFTEYVLGEINDVPLCFSDAAALPNGDLVFSAIAEDTSDSYNDGACVGAAIGIIKKDGSLHTVMPLEPVYKIEGIDACVHDTVVHLTLVTDADDPESPALLLAADIHGYPFDPVN